MLHSGYDPVVLVENVASLLQMKQVTVRRFFLVSSVSSFQLWNGIHKSLRVIASGSSTILLSERKNQSEQDIVLLCLYTLQTRINFKKIVVFLGFLGFFIVFGFLGCFLLFLVFWGV